MMRWLSRWFQRGVDPEVSFAANLTSHTQEFFSRAGQAGFPRGLDWIDLTVQGPPRFVRDQRTRERVALLPAVVQFEPIAGSDMEFVDAARVPRNVILIFRWKGRAWEADAKAVFNLSIDQVITRSGNRFQESRNLA